MKKIWKIFWGVIFLAVCSGCGIKKEQKKTIEDTKEKIYRECEMLAEDYQSIYENAAKENALYAVSYTHLRAHETDSSLFVGSVRCV